MEKNVQTILRMASDNSKDILLEIKELVNNLDMLLFDEGISIN